MDNKPAGRNYKDLENGIKIVTAISKEILVNFGLEKCSKICLKGDGFHNKTYTGSTFENDNKELLPSKAYKPRHTA
jgi:hypothetical protein